MMPSEGSSCTAGPAALWAGVGLVARATTRPVCEVFAGLLARFGVPEEVLTGPTMHLA